MSDYVKIVDFAAKDALSTGNPSKLVKGTEIGAEFDNIATAIATKEDTDNKDQASGYAGLDASSKILEAVIPTSLANSYTTTGALTAARFIVTGATVPANGMYLSAANTVAIAANTTARMIIDSATVGIGGVASVGNAAKTGTDKMVEVSSTTNGEIVGFQAFANDGVNGRRAMLWVDDTAGTFGLTGTASSGVPDFKLEIGALTPMTVTSGGNVSIAAPSSGVTATASTGSGGEAFRSTAAGAVFNRAVNSSASSTLYWGADAGTNGGFIGTESAHQFSLYSNAAIRVAIGSAGNVTINAPSSGSALSVAAGSNWAAWTAASASVSYMSFANAATRGYIGTDGGGIIGSGTGTNFGIRAENDLYLMAGAANRVTIGSSGNITIAAPSSGTAMTVTGVNNTAIASYTDGTTTAQIQTDTSNRAYIGTSSNHQLRVITNNTARIDIGASGNVTINAASSGDELTVTGSVVATSFTGALTGNVTGDVTGLGTLTDASTVNSIQIGFRGIPQNSQSANYTCVLADAGKHILHPSAGGAGDTFTIPANASVAYTIGTTLTFVNRDSNAISIAITSDTMYLAGTTTTGTRTLGQNGVATAIKVNSTEWIISGSGLS